jgi:coenzyme F420-0:L-glutamate ligase/coenzyme F420-1:gamma-L-glutamate ligase
VTSLEPGLTAWPVAGIGEVTTDTDLGALLAALDLADGDVVLVTSKVVSKAEGRTRELDRDEAIRGETVRVVARRGPTSIVENHLGLVMAAAGIDASNVDKTHLVLLPADPDASARALHTALAARGLHVGVIVSDTMGRAWRNGLTDVALGAAGIEPFRDHRGEIDPYGNELQLTQMAVIDELAAAADLVKGKLTGIPAALVRGSGVPVTQDDGPGAASLLRPAREDWFRYGHVEAVAASLGLDPAQTEPPPVPQGSAQERMLRALAVAISSSPPWLPANESPADVVPTTTYLMDQIDDTIVVTQHGAGDDFASAALLAALGQRLSAAAWAEDLVMDLVLIPQGSTPELHFVYQDIGTPTSVGTLWSGESDHRTPILPL